MLQLIPIALFALAGFSSVITAAPTHHQVDAISTGPPTTVEGMFVGEMPSNSWKRHHHQEAEDFELFELSNQFVNEAIAKATSSEHNIMEMIKRQSDETSTEGQVPEMMSFEDMFRNFFDKVIDHIIEVTPLNDIVHGNYDLLYDLFLQKLQELASNIGDNIQNDATEGNNPNAYFGTFSWYKLIFILQQ